MAQVSLSKSSLSREREHLRLYERLLPSLELKRMQLMGELARAETELKKQRSDLEYFQSQVSQQLPMLANREINLSGLVQLESIELGEQNVVGVRLPVLKDLKTKVASYSLLAKPFWVDALVERLHETTELRLKVQVAEERVRRMGQAVRRTTQRLNLFEKIMIPTAEENIKRIQIFLGDAERSAVVRSKLAKARRLKERQESMRAGGEA